MGNEIVLHNGGATGPDEASFSISDLQPLVKGVVLGERYELRNVLGRGGMGIVAMAYDRVLRETVAVKLLRAELAGERRWAERLAREVKIARLIRHRNVCHVFEFQRIGGQAFIVMELARGTLRDELAAGTLAAGGLESRLADIRAVVAGLAAIHDAGIVHRDVSPQNVLRLGDGRLVVSDFGLAVDVDETTMSMHGGTVAYMAPEVVSGGRSAYSSDIWALGVVIHEIAFGRKPSWRQGIVSHGIERPARRLTGPEDAVFALCRACMAPLSRDRPRNASAVLTRLDRGHAHRVRGRRWRTATALVLGAGLIVAAWRFAAAARYWHRLHEEKRQHKPVDGVIEITSNAEDWTSSSRILATVTGKVHCMVPLPDRRTLRFVWGSPNIAEDIDTLSGSRRPSPIVPEAYAQGCPDLSPDGRELIFQGYDPNGRAGIFWAPHANGSNSSFAVPSADASYLSEPRWFAEGKAFVFDADQRHAGVVDRDSWRSTVLPLALEPNEYGLFRFVSGNRVFIKRDATMLVSVVESIAWPSMTLGPQMLVHGTQSQWESTPDGSAFYTGEFQGTSLVTIYPDRSRAERTGSVHGQYIALPTVVGTGLLFLSIKDSFDVWKRDRQEGLRQVTHDGAIVGAAMCRDGTFLVSRFGVDGKPDLGRIDESGHFHRLLSGLMTAPACSLRGDDWWYTDMEGPTSVIYKCGHAGCAEIAKGGYFTNSLSPDETRIAFLATGNRGVHVRWMPSGGGPFHEVADNDGNCVPGWSSNTTLWTSRRRRGVPVWTEVNADTGVETGRTVKGAKDCTDGIPDPLSPVSPDLRVLPTFSSQIRWKALP